MNDMLHIQEIENTSTISVTSAFLTNLAKQLEKNFECISYIATLKNKNTKIFDSIETICGYENAL